MPAKSVKQRRFMGMVRAVQKGEMNAPSPEIAKAANDMGSKAVKEFAKTKEKNLPVRKEETIVERGDFWHPDPDKDRKLGGPGANQRAREDRASAAKKSSGGSDWKKLRPGESYMDYAKRMKTRKEDYIPEEAPTMSTGSTGSAAGFSSEADADGPTAGLDQPLGGTTRLRGKGATPKKRKFKCRKSDDGVNQVCGG